MVTYYRSIANFCTGAEQGGENMTDVLFITPNFRSRDAINSIGTMLLATILRQNGLRADILPLFDFGDPNDFTQYLDNALRMILDKKPKIVSFYTRCDYYHIMLKISQRIKQAADICIVFGGPHSDICAEDTLREIPYVDYVCCGEGENTVYPFFSSLLGGTPDLSVPGLVYRKDGTIVKNPRPALVQDLDTLPEVDYSAFGLGEPTENGDFFPIDVGRGCPFGCTYCSTKTFWGRKYRLKSARRIVDEIKTIHDRYGITRFIFYHDMFTLNRRQVLEVCRLLKELDFPVAWRCCARIDCLDEALIDAMVDAGMVMIFIGIETGSPRMQKLIDKNLKLDSALDLLTYIHNKGIALTTSFIYGFPEETEEDISQTMAMLRDIAKLKRAKIQTHLCTFLPGTEMSETYLSHLTPSLSYSDVTGTTALAECAELVRDHPSLFMQFREYKTPLRTKLADFQLFFKVWIKLQPVYQYFSEHYDADRLVDMYYDFVQYNRQVLDETRDLDMKARVKRVVAEDRFPEHFAGSEYADVVQDFYRMTAMKSSNELKQTGVAMGMFGFSPLEIQRGSRLQDYKRGKVLAIYTRQEDGSVKISVQRGV